MFVEEDEPGMQAAARQCLQEASTTKSTVNLKCTPTGLTGTSTVHTGIVHTLLEIQEDVRASSQIAKSCTGNLPCCDRGKKDGLSCQHTRTYGSTYSQDDEDKAHFVWPIKQAHRISLIMTEMTFTEFHL